MTTQQHTQAPRSRRRLAVRIDAVLPGAVHRRGRLGGHGLALHNGHGLGLHNDTRLCPLVLHVDHDLDGPADLPPPFLRGLAPQLRLVLHGRVHRRVHDDLRVDRTRALRSQELHKLGEPHEHPGLHLLLLLHLEPGHRLALGVAPERVEGGLRLLGGGVELLREPAAHLLGDPPVERALLLLEERADLRGGAARDHLRVAVGRGEVAPRAQLLEQARAHLALGARDGDGHVLARRLAHVVDDLVERVHGRRVDHVDAREVEDEALEAGP
mmetsp:Transcript_28254/g.69863  ORF Transcript_28254/g.69863 Transcript_28254/m.69863 type:complete len:270 (-) Transcript_28254:1772-2581(-)